MRIDERCWFCHVLWARKQCRLGPWHGCFCNKQNGGEAEYEESGIEKTEERPKAWFRNFAKFARQDEWVGVE